MLDVISRWFNRYFSDPQAILLAVLLIVGFTVVISFSDILAPVFAAVVIAYLLEGVVRYMERRDGKRLHTVFIVFVVFMAFMLVLLFGVTPLIWEQLSQLVKDLPAYIAKGESILLQLPQKYAFISEKAVSDLITVIQTEITEFGPKVLTIGLNSIPGAITLLVYLILVPLLVFFFLKDKIRIIDWFTQFLPEERQLSSHVWNEMNIQIANYVRGKFWEILIVGGVSYVVFAIMGIKYSLLLAALVGLSVIVPYIGATVVTIPVALIAFFQWGWSSEFAYLMLAYLIIQGLDGNVLVPLLFSEVVNLHPVAIIVAVLFFGGLWGFWGVFFAIPLATLVNSVLSAWPRGEKEVLEE